MNATQKHPHTMGWKQPDGEIVPVFVKPGSLEGSGTREVYTLQDREPAIVNVIDLVPLLCRPCSGCDGMHHWMEESLDPLDPQNATHPAVLAGEGPEGFPVCMAIQVCKHCDAWRPMPDDSEDDDL